MKRLILNKNYRLLLIIFLLFFGVYVDLCRGNENSDTERLNLEIQLTEEEKIWIDNHRTIRISGPKAFPPFYFIDENGDIAGMAADYTKMIFNALGIKLEAQKDLPWPEVLKKIKSNKLDLITCAAKSEDRESFMIFSEAYLTFPMVIASKKDAPFIGGLDDLYGKKVACISRGIDCTLLAQDQPGIKLHEVGSMPAALEAVSVGQADALMGNLAAVSYLIEKKGISNLKIAAPTKYGNYSLYFAVRKDWPELIGIINKALSAISPDQNISIRSRWLSVRYEHGLRPLDIIKWVLAVVCIAAAVLSIVFTWNRRLQREVADRKKTETEKETLIEELKTALDNIKTLKGLIPICSQCKKIRDDTGYWGQIESYIQEHSDAEFSHGMCPECMDEIYGEEDWYKRKIMQVEKDDSNTFE